MKKGLIVIFSLSVIFVACSESSEDLVAPEDKSVENKWVEEDSVLIIKDSVIIDTSSLAVDSVARVDYENDLSLEIKEIEEEIENPISEDCKMFLEDYAEGIKSFASITEKVAANPEDIGLQIQLSSASEDINASNSSKGCSIISSTVPSDGDSSETSTSFVPFLSSS